jgi:hypothetical protein
VKLITPCHTILVTLKQQKGTSAGKKLLLCTLKFEAASGRWESKSYVARILQSARRHANPFAGKEKGAVQTGVSDRAFEAWHCFTSNLQNSHGTLISQGSREILHLVQLEGPSFGAGDNV